METMAETRNLTAPFSAYRSQTGLLPDDELTQVGRATPGGEYLRRFWQPIAFTQELGDVPMRVRVMGEDLVLFRDHGGNIGLLELHCSHRGSSLEFGIIAQRGLRCCYHGWLYDIDGRILETGVGPILGNGPEVWHGAYPLHVYAGLIFAYMGPPDLKPPFPMYDVYGAPGITVEPALDRTHDVHCNWLQIVENGMDPAHTAFLHVIVSGKQPNFSEEMGILPVLQFHSTPLGCQYVACRRVGDNVWIRVVDLMMPNLVQIAVDDQRGGVADISQRAFLGVWAVPIDDHSTRRISLLFEDKRAPLRPTQKVRAFGQIADRPYEERQRRPGDYDAQVSQGPVNIHGYEHLSTSDYGVILFRDSVRKGIRAVQQGLVPQGMFMNEGPIKTYAQNTVLHAPRAATPELDDQLLRQLGRRVVDGDYRDRFPPR
jgi:nitrite reductase/ring-hydroxylating ferredoxin subunit